MMRPSLISDHGPYVSSCGYCGTRATHEDSSWSHGMMAEVLTPEAYQALIDRGWRRSGHWMYQPRNESTCCQLITIRLDVHAFKPNKEQRRAARFWEDYLAGGPMKQQQQQHASAQQPQGEQGSEPAQQAQQAQQRLVHNPDGVEFPASAGSGAQAWGAEPRGASPKRPHEDLEGEGPGAGALGADAGATAADDVSAGFPGAAPGSKRQRWGAGDWAGGGGSALLPLDVWGDDGLMEGASPRTQLASQMQQVFLPPQLATSEGAAAAAAASPAAAAAVAAHPAAALTAAGPAGLSSGPTAQQHSDAPLDGVLASTLAAALRRCVAEGLLPGPAGAYPAPRVQAPNAKQKKMLAPDVAYTSAFPLAVAAAAARRAKEGGPAGSSTSSSSKGASVAAGADASQSTSLPQEQQQQAQQAQQQGQQGQGPLPSAEAVAQLLVERAQLPGRVAVTADRGHLNFHNSKEGSSSAGQPGSSEQSGGGVTPAAACEAQAPQRRQQQQAQQQQQGAARGGPLPTPAGAQAAGPSLLTLGVAASGAAGAEAEPGRASTQQGGDGAGTAAAVGVIPRGVRRHFELTMVRSDASLVSLEFALYQKYQVVHHGDDPVDVTPRSFQRFLCDSPIRHAPQGEYPSGGCPPCGYGSFHQQYWLDGRLVAVGVVDILPSCLSSVYLFWDPDLAPLSLGRVSALKEIEWVKEHSAACPSLHYYYLGFYIHNNHRMRYKGDYGPSDLLCPKNKCWVPLDRCRQALEQPGMAALSELPGAVEGLGPEYLVGAGGRAMAPPSEPTEEEVDNVKVFIRGAGGKGQMVTLSVLCRAGILSAVAQRQLRRRVAQWVKAVGPAWPSILYRI